MVNGSDPRSPHEPVVVIVTPSAIVILELPALLLNSPGKVKDWLKVGPTVLAVLMYDWASETALAGAFTHTPLTEIGPVPANVARVRLLAAARRM